MALYKENWKNSAFSRSIHALPFGDRRKMYSIIVIQILLGFLDLFGVICIGLLGAVSVTDIKETRPTGKLDSVLRIIGLSEAPFQKQVIVLGSLSILLLVGRTLLSVFFTRRILFFLSRRGAIISANLISRLLSQPLLFVQSKTSQETLYAITTGVTLVTIQVLATAAVLISDIALLVILALGLFIVDPITALSTLLVFAIIGLLLYKSMHLRASDLGKRSSEFGIKSNEKIVEVLSSYRESVVRNRRHYYAREIGKLRYHLADATAEISFMPYISKYVIETAVILGAIFIGAFQFIFQDATHAVSTLAIFLAAGTRIAPAVLRAQQGSIQIRSSLGQATPTLDLIASLSNVEVTENLNDTLDLVHEDFESKIQITQLQLTYPGKGIPAIANLTLSVDKGDSVAIVGPSGAGKTTLIDALLGVLVPDSGSVSISGISPQEAVNKWPGAIAYVPQDVAIAAGTIRENIALGYPNEFATDALVLKALKIAHLDEFVLSLPHGLETQVGERGARLSGGQRQRLGIARALFTNPQLLVLDEATSALDAETEEAISRAIHSLRGSITVIMIAHRLSTVRKSDLVVYLDCGKIVSLGTFEEVRASVPDFDSQAKLMGI